MPRTPRVRGRHIRTEPNVHAYRIAGLSVGSEIVLPGLNAAAPGLYRRDGDEPPRPGRRVQRGPSHN